jgi:hypothetical protein
MARRYILTIKVSREVCLDSVFQCRACGYTSPYRAWGRSNVSDEASSSIPEVALGGDKYVLLKRRAADIAWSQAHRNLGLATCPRCVRHHNPLIQFSVPV